MVLCEERKFDQKNRVFIPKTYIMKAGGKENGECYVMFDEETKEIKIVFKEEKEKK